MFEFTDCDCISVLHYRRLTTAISLARYLYLHSPCKYLHVPLYCISPAGTIGINVSVWMCPRATSQEEFYLGCRVQRRWQHGNLKDAQWPLGEILTLGMDLANAPRVTI